MADYFETLSRLKITVKNGTLDVRNSPNLVSSKVNLLLTEHRETWYGKIWKAVRIIAHRITLGFQKNHFQYCDNVKN